MRHVVLLATLLLGATGCNDMRDSRRPVASDNSGPVASDNTGRVASDNTGVNVRDRADTKTPIDQNENQRDIDITAEIRKQVVDSEMSVNAQNVKIITQDGRVTLRGPVANDEEKNRIEAMASKVAGTDNVQTELEVDATR